MKANRLFLPLLVAMLLISGCEKAQVAEPEAPVPTAVPTAAGTPEATAEPAKNQFSEPYSIDDSYSMPKISYTGNSESYRAARYETIANYGLAKWFDNPKVKDFRAKGGQVMYGWVLFTGEPKQDLGWQTVEVDGQQMYCRSFTATLDGETWNVEKSYAMLPYSYLGQYDKILPSTKLPEGCTNFQLANLSSAQLYVRQLDEVYTIEDEPSLHKLEAALSYQQDYRSGYSYLLGMNNEALNPLYLYFKDGSSRLVYTRGDGSCGADIWDSSMFNSGESLFEMFNVPLPSPGYIHNEDGSTTVQVDTYYIKRTATEETRVDTQLESIYDSDNKLLAKIGPESADYYYFCEDGLLDHSDYYFDGEIQGTTSYVYNEARQLIRWTYIPVDGITYYYEFAYDEMRRMTSSLSYYGSGAPRENTYFWYDEAGEQYQYHYENGEIIGDIPPSDNPVRRESA